MKWEILLGWMQESKRVIEDEEAKVRTLEAELQALKRVQVEGDKSQQSIAQEKTRLEEENSTLRALVSTQANDIRMLTSELMNVRKELGESEQRVAELQLQVTKLTSADSLQSDSDLLRLSASKLQHINELAVYWEKCLRFIADPNSKVEPNTRSVVQSGTSFRTHEYLTNSFKLVWDVCNGDIQTGFVLLNGQEPLGTDEKEKALKNTKNVSAVLSGVMRSICFRLNLGVDIWKKRVFFFYQPQMKVLNLTSNHSLFFNVAWSDPDNTESSAKLFWIFQFYHSLSLSSSSLNLASHSLGLLSFVSWITARNDCNYSAQICKTLIETTEDDCDL